MKVNEQRKESHTRRKLMAMIVSVLVCLLVIGVTVYAATNNQVSVGDSVTVSPSGDALVSVRVDRKLGGTEVFNTLGSDTAKVAEILNVSQHVFLEMISVAPGQNGDTTAAAKGMPNVEFNIMNGYTYVVYKITLTNSDNRAATYQITGFPAASSWDSNNQPQIEYFYSDGVNMVTEAALGAEGTGFSGTLSANTMPGYSKTIYVVAAVIKPLAELVPVSAQPFEIKIGVRGYGY